MGDQQQQASAGAGTKKPLSDLTKEELIEKCKHFLTLAQKAKAAKDETMKECQELREKSEKFSVLNEMVEKMKEEKMQFASLKDEMRRKLQLSEKNTEKLHSTEEKFELLSKDSEQKDEILKKLKKKIENLETENEGTKRQLDRTVKENDSLLEQIDSLDQDLSKMTAELKEYKAKAAQLHSFEEQNQELKAKIICLEQNVRDKTVEKDAAKKEVATLKEERTSKEAELEKENAELRLQLEERVHDNVEEMNKVLADKEIEIVSLKEKLSHRSAVEAEKMNAETESLQSRLSSQEETVEKQVREIELLLKKVEEKENEVVELKKRISDLEERMTVKDETIREMTDHNKALSEQLTAAVDENKESLGMWMDEKDRTESEVALKEAELAELKEQLLAASESQESLSRQTKVLSDKLTEVTEKLKIADNEREQIKQDLVSKEELLIQIKEEVATSLKSQGNLVKEKEQRIVELSREIQQLNEQQSSSGAETDESSKRIVEENIRSKSDLDSREKELADMREQLLTVASSNEHLTNDQKVKIENLSTQIELLNDRLMSSEKSLQQTIDENDGIKSALAAKEKEVSELEEQTSIFAGEKDSRIEELLAEVSQLKDHLASSGDDKNESIRGLTEEIERKKSDLASKEKYIVELREQLEALSSSRAELKESFQESIKEKENLKLDFEAKENIITELNKQLSIAAVSFEDWKKIKEDAIEDLSNKLKLAEEQLAASELGNDECLKATLEEKERLQSQLAAKECEITEIKVQLSELSQSYEDKIKEKESAIESLSLETEGNLAKLSEKDESVMILSQEKNNLEMELKQVREQLESTCQDMENVIAERNSETERLKLEICDLKDQMCLLETNQGAAFDALLQETRAIKSELEDFTKLKEEHSLTVQALTSARDMVNSLEEILSQHESKNASGDQEQRELLRSQLRSMQDVVKALSNEVANYRGVALSQLTSFSQVLKECGSSFEEWKLRLETELSSSQQQNSDLLEDLNKINLEIRARGSKISNLTERNDELSSKIESLHSELEEREKTVGKLKQEIEELQSSKLKLEEEMEALKREFADREAELTGSLNESKELRDNLAIESTKILNEVKEKLTEKEKEIEKLNHQITELTETVNNRSLPLNRSSNQLDESQSEVMSNSTISKVEEVNRMADIEATFEDRYTKLKLVAIKLKKKTVDQDKKIAELEQGQKESGKLSQVLANFNSLQSEYDSLQDTSENQASQIKVLNKDLEQSVQECIRTKEKLAATETDLSDKTLRLGSVSAELGECQSRVKSLEDEKQRQEKTIAKLSAENKELNEKLNQVVAKLDQLTNMNKKQDLLDMELEEAESRISQLTQLYEETRSKLESKELELKLELEARHNREMQIVEMEDTLNKETERAQDLKAKLTDSRATISAMEESLAQSGSKLEKLERELDLKRSEGEKLALQLAEISGNAMTSAKSLTSRNDSLQKMVTLLETEVDRKKQRAEELEARLTSLEKDYENYKVRAQSVLRQAKDKDSHLNEKSQEVANLERVVNSLNEKIHDISTQHAAMDLERRHLQEDHDRLMERHSALLQEMAAKEKGAREKVDQLNKTLSETELSRQNAVTHWQQEAENIRQNYRSEIESLTSLHAAEVARLQQNIDKLDNQVIRLQMLARKSPSAQHQNGGNHQQRHPSSSPHLTDIELSLLEREAAEGSESADTSYQRGLSLSPINQIQRFGKLGDESGLSQHPLLPLDQLLLQKEEENESQTLSRQVSEVSVGGDTWTENAAVLEKRANSAEKQVKHMASLLSESEAENARLIELAQVLKEEIRSYRRSEERSKHIENLEYVKNVILKFLTMPESVERARLIPILTTILKLSKEEVERVQSVVTAETEQVATPETGWSSYLGLWNP